MLFRLVLRHNFFCLRFQFWKQSFFADTKKFQFLHNGLFIFDNKFLTIFRFTLPSVRY